MKCPKCHSKETRTYKSEIFEGIDERYRNRICIDCQTRFTTIETYGKVKVEDGQAIEVTITSDYTEVNNAQ